VVVLDENPVIQAEPMIGAAADADRILVEQPPSRQGFPRIHDPRTRPVNGLHEAARERGHAAHTL
jgi:hypothetical protein